MIKNGSKKQTKTNLDIFCKTFLSYRYKCGLILLKKCKKKLKKKTRERYHDLINP